MTIIRLIVLFLGYSALFFPDGDHAKRSTVDHISSASQADTPVLSRLLLPFLLQLLLHGASLRDSCNRLLLLNRRANDIREAKKDELKIKPRVWTSPTRRNLRWEKGRWGSWPPQFLHLFPPWISAFPSRRRRDNRKGSSSRGDLRTHGSRGTEELLPSRQLVWSKAAPGGAPPLLATACASPPRGSGSDGASWPLSPSLRPFTPTEVLQGQVQG